MGRVVASQLQHDNCNTITIQPWQSLWIWAIWYRVQGSVGITKWRGGCCSEDSQGRFRGGGQGQVPPGGSHHGTVQTPGDVWSGHSRIRGNP